MRVLIGDTGLVGKALVHQIGAFDHTFNSSNIHRFLELVEDECDLYLSCLPATKWLVNKNIAKDLKNIWNILDVISKKSYKTVYLISTIDVYCDSPLGVDETYSPRVKNLNYGSNRYLFELLIDQLVCKQNLKIFRLPALYNDSIKKNVIYDLIHDNNVQNINSNSAYQWFDLDSLANTMTECVEKYPNEKIFNLFPAPIETKFLLEFWPNYTIPESTNRVEYNYRTKFTESGYLYSKDEGKK